MPTQPSLPLAKFLNFVDSLGQANHFFFQKREISPLAHKDLREAALGQGLAALARCFNVKLVEPLHVDSRGEFMIAVDQKTEGVWIVNSANGNRVFGQEFTDLLNGFSPRTGMIPSAILDPVNSWCYMNHFSVEKMLVAAAERFKSQVLGPERLGPGLEIVTMRGEVDLDEESQERFTPVGAVGVLVEQHLPGQWEVHFGDAAVHISEGELFNPGEYRFRTPFRNQVRELLAECGVTVAEDSDQPGLWVWYGDAEGCDSSFGTEGEAVDDAFAVAIEHARVIRGMDDARWGEVTLPERMGIVQDALSVDRPAVVQR